jgi:hypothetical protein
MARLSKGVDTSKLPSAQELLALSTTPGAGEGVEKLAAGVTSGLDLADRLASRKMEREKAMLVLQETIRKAKEEALQKQREQAISQELSGTSPAATRVAANIGGQPVMAKETKTFADAAPARLQAAISSAAPMDTAKETLGRESQRLQSAQDAEEAINLQNLKFKQAKELQGMKDKAKGDKPGKIPVSLINDQNLISNQEKQIDEIENALAPLNKATGKRQYNTTGAKGFAKTLLSKATLGNVGGTDLRLYDQNRPAVAVSLYRALTGDTRLSDADAKARALPLLPTGGEPKEVQQKKIKFLREGIQRRKRVLAQVSEMAKNNDLTPDQIDAVRITPLPTMEGTAEEANEVDPTTFIEE